MNSVYRADAVQRRLQRNVLLILVLALLTACTARTSTSSQPATPTAVPSSTPVSREEETRFSRQREQMVVKTIKNRGITDEDVLQAMENVPRHLFVPEDQQDAAYGDYPLPIGFGQTISQPYIVAMMTELLELEEGDKVLEVGTGSGYQAAVLAELPEVEVYSIEIIPELADKAEETLKSLGYTDVHCKQGDGYYGWPEHAPFDGIIVTAAPDHVPAPLREQLAVDGRMVIPIGPRGGYQTLWQFVKQPDGELKAYNKGGVAFVPFTGKGIRGNEEGGGWPP
jgi:protein-L-isoaspartate(D-aspartate) O-methyltransferase